MFLNFIWNGDFFIIVSLVMPGRMSFSLVQSVFPSNQKRLLYAPSKTSLLSFISNASKCPFFAALSWLRYEAMYEIDLTSGRDRVAFVLSSDTPLYIFGSIFAFTENINIPSSIAIILIL